MLQTPLSKFLEFDYRIAESKIITQNLVYFYLNKECTPGGIVTQEYKKISFDIWKQRVTITGYRFSSQLENV